MNLRPLRFRMKLLPKQFLIGKPKKGTPVTVHSDPRKPWRGVVTDLLLDSPDLVQVTKLATREQEAVSFRVLTRLSL